MSNIPGSYAEPREIVLPTYAEEASKLRRAHRLLLEAQALMQNDSGSYPQAFSDDLCDACDGLDRAIEQAVRAARPVIRQLDASAR